MTTTYKHTHSRRGFIKGAGLLAGGTLGSQLASPGSAVGASQAAPAFTSKGARLRARLAKPDPLAVPVVPDVLAARLAELEGYEAVMIGSSWIAGARYALPDVGLLTMSELVAFAGNIADHVDVPVVADGEMGGGGPLNVYRSTQELERAGVGAVFYQDTVQTIHVTRQGGELVSRDHFVDKIKAAVDARKDDLVIIAFNHSLSEGYGMQDALERGVAYAEAGADLLFFLGMSLEDSARAADRVRKPLMMSAGPSTTLAQAKAAKVGLLFYHVDYVGLGAIHQALKEWKTTGKVEGAAKLSIGADVRNKLTGADAWISRARQFNATKTR
jgi:2-methylisocitrate lyase-like PEP mutase family enzyme